MPKDEANADKRITADQADQLSGSFELDLIAFFAELRDQMLGELQRCCDEGESPEEAISRVVNVL